MIQGKKYIDKLRLRNKAIGKELRKNMSKKILEYSTPFPKSVNYKDIDDEFKKFVTDKLSVSYDGIQLPTYSLFSNQRIGEYSQTWKYTDNLGNIIMNFKTITRENNPQKGKMYGESYNIPSDINFEMFKVPVLQENGQETIDIYTMKQPMPIDFVYTVNIITNKYELLNEFNTLVNIQFKGLQCYIFPNEHPMSMKLENISDESEYSIDERKFYSQSYKINLRGYIIRKEDFQVEHLPSRVLMVFEGDRQKNKHNKWKNIISYDDPCRIVETDDKYKHRGVEVRVNFDTCEIDVSFNIDINMVIESIELVNIFDFILYINDECVNVEDIENLTLFNGDKIRIKISKDNDGLKSLFTIIGYNKDVIIDKTANTESSLDDESDREQIDVNKN